MRIKLIVAGLLAGGIVAGAQAAALNIHTETVVRAPAQEIWDVLVDIASNGEWNPYHVAVDGVPAEGERVALTIRKPDGRVIRIRPRVRKVEPHRMLVWGGGVGGIFRGEHVFEPVPLGEGCTRLIQREVFDGIAVPFAHLDGIEEEYRRVNASLEERVEGQPDVGACA